MSVDVEERPIWVVRKWREKAGRIDANLYDEDGKQFLLPSGTFHWDLERHGEEVALRGYKARASEMEGLGLVLTHDCEIDNDRRHHLVVVMIRPLSDLNEPEVVLSGNNHAALYLPADESIGLEETFVDFRRLTAYRQEALRPDDRLASMTETFRGRLAMAFYRFLFRRLPGEGAEP